jgi:hypothetical protein
MPIKDPVRRREYQRENMRRWRARNPDRAREITRRADENRKALHPTSNRKRCACYYEKHHDRIREQIKARYWANPEPVRAANRRSYAAHAEQRRAYARAYRRRLKEARNGKL